ncbi:extensin family protein [Roseobacter sp.]|uniref:extensin-like domain-containing protein n=1 Tax=Roseobacter sp. TaxID=1907202 RepID=UPI0025F7A390|nr:extensin family protein [Roseobacter sp.]
MIRLVLSLVLVAGIAQAGPDTSPRPELRPVTNSVTETETTPAPAPAPPAKSVPGRRADSAAPTETQDRDRATATAQDDSSLRPQARPRKFEQRATEKARLKARGAICEDPDILGESVGRVASGVKGCGIASAVRVRSVSGVSLSPAAVMDCTTARTLRHFVSVSAIPRVAAEGGADLVNLRIVGHYACRPRNNRPGARISEHGKGRAIDISEFRLSDGSVISVKRDWNSKKGFRPLREMHRDACGIFGTVLGPQSDRFHEDHFHFDTARHRSGSYCR